jgi:hypothetical protein
MLRGKLLRPVRKASCRAAQTASIQEGILTTMKSTVWISAAVFVLGSMVGCGGKEQGASSSAPVVDAKQPAAQSTADATVAVTAGTPAQAVSSFLSALQTGDEKAAATLLTTKAREETVAHDMVVEPPGAPNATYSVGRVQHPDNNPDAAYVSCVWSEKYENGEEESYEVVWVLRREATGWRVAGMATQLANAEKPVFLDFEDLTAMEDTVKKAESAKDAANGTAAAKNPETNNAVR